MKFFLTCSLLIINLISIGQQLDPNANISIKYDFNYVTDSLFRDKVYKERMILYVNKRQSSFLSYSKLIEDSISITRMDSMMQTGKLVSQKKINRIQSTIHKYFSNDTLAIVQEYLTNFFLIKVKQEPIIWQILTEKKIILDYTCQKAICLHKGRTYEVWFTNDLPISAGPWKLNGLPGIILEAKDSKSEVIFLCTEIKQINYSNNYLKLPDNLTVTTQKEFDELKDYYTNNPTEALKAVIGNNDFSLKVASDKPLNSQKRVIKKPKNPIELSN